MLRLSKEVDYGLMTLVYLALEGPDRTPGRMEIARKHNIPADFLSKVMVKLRRGGLVRSYRGTRGGYRLARPASQITLADLVEAMDRRPSLTECGGAPDRPCAQWEGCTVRDPLRVLEARIVGILRGTTLNDLARAEPNRRAGDVPRHLRVGAPS